MSDVFVVSFVCGHCSSELAVELDERGDCRLDESHGCLGDVELYVGGVRDDAVVGADRVEIKVEPEQGEA
jgi:hypothetical protein